MTTTKVTITLGEALRLVTSKAARISELLDERQRASWGYEETKSQVRPFSEICDNLEYEVADRIHLKALIAAANLATKITYRDEELDLQTANLKIDYLRKETKSLKQLLEDPTGIDSYGGGLLTRRRMGARTTEDILAQPFFVLADLRIKIADMEVQVRELDSLRNKKNWSTGIIAKLYYT